MRDIVVRPARSDDQPALQRIFRRASLTNASDREALLTHPEVLQVSDRLIDRGRTRVATLADDTVVGFATTSPNGESVLELDDLFVAPEWQGRGAARRLLDQIVTEATAGRITRIEVTANPHALGFYRNAGFQQEGSIDTSFGVGMRMYLHITQRSRTGS